MAETKREVGRPELPADEKRAHKLPVRFSERDLDRVRAQAARSRQSIAEWVRGRLGLDG